MRQKGMVKRPATEKEEVVSVACDLCGKKVRTPYRPTEWSTEIYRVDEVTIEHKRGSSFPENGSGTYRRFDICADCFESRVVPAIEALGAHVGEEEWDY